MPISQYKKEQLAKAAIKSIRLRSFNAAMGLADGTLTADEVVQRALDISNPPSSPVAGMYFLLNVASFLPDNWEFSIRRALQERLVRAETET